MRTKEEAIAHLERLEHLHKLNAKEAREKGNQTEFYYQAGAKDAISDVLEVVNSIE